MPGTTLHSIQASAPTSPPQTTFPDHPSLSTQEFLFIFFKALTTTQRVLNHYPVSLPLRKGRERVASFTAASPMPRALPGMSQVLEAFVETELIK